MRMQVRSGGAGIPITTDSNGNNAGLTTTEITKDYRGNYPETLYDQATAQTADATDNAVSAGINMVGYDGIVFDATTNDATLQVSIDGSTWAAVTVDHPFIDLGVAARTIITTTNGNVGPFFIETPFNAVRFLNHAASQATVTFARVGKTPAISR